MKQLLTTLACLCLVLAADSTALANMINESQSVPPAGGCSSLKDPTATAGGTDLGRLIDPANGSQHASFLLRDAVRQEIEHIKPGLYFAVIAEVVRGDVRACLVWPALYQGEFLDDDIVGFAFRQDGERWIPVKGNFLLSSGDGREKLADVMGGADYKVIKPDGILIYKLPTHWREENSRLHLALKRKRFPDAIDVIESLSRAFSLNMAAFDDAFTEALIENFSAQASLDINRFEADQEDVRADADMTLVLRNHQGHSLRQMPLRVRLVRIGRGWAIDYVTNLAGSWSVGGPP